MDIATVLDKYGLPISVIVVLGWFLFRELWPWAKKTIEEATADRRQERDKFLQALHYLTSVTETQAALNQKTTTDFADQMQQLSDSVSQVVTAVQFLCEKDKAK